MALRIGADLPSFAGATEWLNAVSAPELLGRPVLVHFWAVSCYLCKNNFKTLESWKQKYVPLGLAVVAVHMPRQEEDTAIEGVRDAIAEFHLTEPCALDNQHLLKDAFGNDQAWVPAYFLFDSDGKLRSRAAGEAGLGIIEGALDRMYSSAPVEKVAV